VRINSQATPDYNSAWPLLSSVRLAAFLLYLPQLARQTPTRVWRAKACVAYTSVNLSE